MRTIEQLAKEAIDAQNAINLSGVVHAFSRAITELREIARAEGWESTDKLNTHPICVLWSSKIASLTGSEEPLNFADAYTRCDDLVTGKTTDYNAELCGTN